MASIFLDTNAYSAFLLGNQTLSNEISGSEGIHLSLIVLGELLAGYRRGSRKEENLRDLETFLAKPNTRLTVPTRNTADYYALIKNQLRAKGKPIPTNDIWIAAQCLEHGAVLLSRDTHFEHVEGLRLKRF